MPLRVLLVEDFEDCATMTAAVLRRLGRSVRVVHTGPAALAACREERPAVVLLELGLQGMSGFEVAEHLRQEFGDAAPAIIAVTAYGRAADIERSAAAGIDLHLVKPVDFFELNAILDRIKRRPSQSI